MTVEPGYAVIDTAASQCLVGVRRIEELATEVRNDGYKEMGLPVRKGFAPRGIGGEAVVVKRVCDGREERRSFAAAGGSFGEAWCEDSPGQRGDACVRRVVRH